ncbi:methionyl-tRNA formyltransferase [Candidatus Falkowbacteria bacterium]|nr:methionyl-tRNA formyltransferase [Candidatus Falkowbacteria bacterium]
MAKKIRIVFAGTPNFAAPFLNSLSNESDFEVVAVLTRPDKPVGRDQVLTYSPIKELAKKKNINILQPENIKDEKIIIDLFDLSPDFLVVAAFGQIIPREILNIAKYGNINAHPSLLPKYRGASPIQSAILNGDQETGITIMLMDELMDHGPILAQQKISLNGDETADTLHKELAEVGKTLLIKTIKQLSDNAITPQPQNHDSATYCKIIKKNNAKINWLNPAQTIERQIRAYYPWPTAWTTYGNKRLKIFPPAKILDDIKSKKPGEVFLFDNQLAVACGQDDALIISGLQLEGRPQMNTDNFLRGNKKIINQTLG